MRVVARERSRRERSDSFGIRVKREAFRRAKAGISRRIEAAKAAGVSVVMSPREAQDMLFRFQRAEERMKALEAGLDVALLELRRLGREGSIEYRKIEAAAAFSPAYRGTSSNLLANPDRGSEAEGRI